MTTRLKKVIYWRPGELQLELVVAIAVIVLRRVSLRRLSGDGFPGFYGVFR